MEVICLCRKDDTDIIKCWNRSDGVFSFLGANFFDKKAEMGRARAQEVRQRAEVCTVTEPVKTVNLTVYYCVD